MALVDARISKSGSVGDARGAIARAIPQTESRAAIRTTRLNVTRPFICGTHLHHCR
jgi:hypothetical protein